MIIDKIHVFDHDKLSKQRLSFFGNYKLILRIAAYGNYLNTFINVYTPKLFYYSVSWHGNIPTDCIVFIILHKIQ